ncbi:MAG: dihydrofolate reductase [Clostridiales bacterium]|jgi:dihydrofolate reductase|nr:dihydrofolate reductase [Clostridiales bacterium]
MNLIVATEENWGIGYRGRLLTAIPADMKYFREKTEGKTVIMGRATLESLPASKPLKNRTNIVLSRNAGLTVDGAEVCGDVAALLRRVAARDDVYVIGGQEIYALLLPYCANAFVTKIHAKYPADKFFPNLDALENWRVAWQSEPQRHNETAFTFFRYENSAADAAGILRL